MPPHTALSFSRSASLASCARLRNHEQAARRRNVTRFCARYKFSTPGCTPAQRRAVRNSPCPVAPPQPITRPRIEKRAAARIALPTSTGPACRSALLVGSIQSMLGSERRPRRRGERAAHERRRVAPSGRLPLLGLGSAVGQQKARQRKKSVSAQRRRATPPRPTARRIARQQRKVPVLSTVVMSSAIRPDPGLGLKLVVNLHLSSILVRGSPL